MVVDADAHRRGGGDDPAGRLDVALARLVAAGRVVVDENDAHRADVERALDHLARIGRRLADRPFPDEIVGDQLVARGEEERAEPLVAKVRHVRPEIIEQLARGGDDRSVRQRQSKAVEQAFLDEA